MINRLYFFFVVGIFSLLLSCDDIFLENITNDQVVIVAPADSIQTRTDQQTFLWNKLNGASSYRLLIVSPNLVYASSVVADTTLTDNFFSILLDPGQYEWCVKGVNEGYETANNCRILEVTQ